MPKHDCQCQSWKTNRDKIPNLLLLQSAANLTEKAAEFRFQFCPWCGTKLENFEIPTMLKFTKKKGPSHDRA